MVSPPRYVVASGHMVDRPERPSTRFPSSEVARVAAAIRQAFDDWGVDASTTVVTGGARGADILTGEEALARRARLRVVLAKPAADYERESVELAGSDWVRRFHALLANAEIEVVQVRGDESPFERANARIVEVAKALGGDGRAVIVWDGEQGDGAGGTADIVRRLGWDMADDRVRVIDPRPRQVPTNR